MRRRVSVLTPLILAIMLGVAGCDRLSTGPGSGGSGITLLLTDAPGELKAAVVTISEIYLQGDGGRTVLVEEPVTADLLQLRSALATIVQGVEVPAGRYTELRLVLEGAYIEVEVKGGGSRIYASSPDYAGLAAGAHVGGRLHMPSLGSSGLKIKLPGHLHVGEGESVIMIDFDVKESFGHEAGKSGKWVLKPKIKATDVTFGGHVVARLQLGSGVVLPAVGGQAITLGAFTARLTPVGGGAHREVPLADVDGDQVFEAMFKGIAAGTYNLDFLGPAGLTAAFAPTLPRSVTVVAKQTATETVTVTSATAGTSVTATLRLNAGVALPSVGGSAITLAHFRARLAPFPFGAGMEVSFTDANNDGTFEARFGDVSAGTKVLTILPPAGVGVTFGQSHPVLLNIVEGTSLTREFVITSANPT